MLIAIVAIKSAGASNVSLPARTESVKFAVLSDFGTGEPDEYAVAAQMTAFRQRFPFDFVITTGDNIMGKQDAPADFVEKFERPFRPLLDRGVRFYASLGNHDRPSNRSYSPWNMNGRRYYAFAVKNTRFFALDSNRPDRDQLSWLEGALASSKEQWKICYFHHPLYSDGLKHGADLELRVLLEPLLARHGVNVVFSGHDHVYQRLNPQRGITYFVAGPGGDHVHAVRRTAASDSVFEAEQTFTAVEVSGDSLFFETVSRSGRTVDSGVIRTRGQGSTGGGK